jgi:hypothetical protein
VVGNRHIKLCYISRDDSNYQIRTRKKRTHVDKYSFVNRAIKNCKQLHAGLLVFFFCKLNTFRKRIKKVVTNKAIEVGIECK